MPDNEHTLDPNSRRHQEAVQALFVKNSRDLRFFVLSLLPSADDVDDILQEVFLVITKKAHQFTLGTNFRAWVFRIARITVLNELRKSKKRPCLLEDDVLELLACEGETVLADTSMLDALGRCLNKLDGRMKQFVRMRYEDGLKSSKIAEAFGWTPNAVYVTLSRARLSLRKCVERELRHREATS